VITPIQSETRPEPQKRANRAHAKLSGPRERANAQLKRWKILPAPRRNPGNPATGAKPPLFAGITVLPKPLEDEKGSMFSLHSAYSPRAHKQAPSADLGRFTSSPDGLATVCSHPAERLSCPRNTRRSVSLRPMPGRRKGLFDIRRGRGIHGSCEWWRSRCVTAGSRGYGSRTRAGLPS
jgi:hypothetical protein